MAMTNIVLCISALLVQGIAGRCFNPSPSCGCSGGSINTGSVSCNRGATEIISVGSPSISVSNTNCASSPIVVSGPGLASSGGAFITTSLGAFAPSGIRVDNTNELSGDLFVSGALPYLTAVAFEGSFANNGVASIAYGCGDGEIAITEVIGGAAPSASYNNAIFPAANYNGAILPARNCGCA